MKMRRAMQKRRRRTLEEDRKEDNMTEKEKDMDA